MLAVVGVLLVAGPIFMVHCLAGVDVAIDGLDAVELELQIVFGRLLRARMIRKS